IALVCDFYRPAIGGVNKVVEELAERYAKLGHEVHVYCSDWDKTKRIKIKDEVINGVHVHRCFHIFRAVNFITLWPGVLWGLFSKKFDIIHSHLSFHPHSFFAALVAKISGVSHIHTTHCPWSDARRSLFGKIMLNVGYQTFIKAVFKWNDRIIAITPWEIQFIKEHGGDESKIVYIPNGMDKSFFSRIKNNDFKKRLGIKGKLVLYFGRLNETKGPDKFVLAAKEILKDRNDITFVIRGPDEGMRETVKRLIGNEKKIILMEPTRDKQEILKTYQAADVYALPSYREGLPLTLFEAFASGLPVVASPVNGVPYEMEDGKNGIFVSYGDIQGLKKAILRILDDKKLTSKFKKNNIEKAKKYDWDIIARKTLEVYKK
ncbi:MAG: glycosyltransferase family 4 protein, partial [Nanoarchaeota archaeon]